MDVDKNTFQILLKESEQFLKVQSAWGRYFINLLELPWIKIQKSLETSMEESLKLQPAIDDVEVEIRFDKLEESMTEFDYTSLSGDMLDVRIYTKVENVKAIIRIEFIEELNYPLMYVEDIEEIWSLINFF